MKTLIIMYQLLSAMEFNCLYNKQQLTCGHSTTKEWVIVTAVSKEDVNILTSAMGYPKPVLGDR